MKKWTTEQPEEVRKMKSTKAMKTKEAVEMKKALWVVPVLVLLGGLIAGLIAHAAVARGSSKPKVFPFSTQLGGIRCEMPLKEVISRFGSKYKGFYSAVSGETPTWCIGYNDPSKKGSILIDSGAGDKKDAESVCAIILSAKPIAKAPKAKVSFLKEGTAAGIKLGDSLKQVKKLYPSLRGPYKADKRGRLLCYISDVPSPEEWPCFVSFYVKDNKVVEIFSGYAP